VFAKGLCFAAATGVVRLCALSVVVAFAACEHTGTSIHDAAADADGLAACTGSPILDLSEALPNLSDAAVANFCRTGARFVYRIDCAGFNVVSAPGVDCVHVALFDPMTKAWVASASRCPGLSLGCTSSEPGFRFPLDCLVGVTGMDLCPANEPDGSVDGAGPDSTPDDGRAND